MYVFKSFLLSIRIKKMMTVINNFDIDTLYFYYFGIVLLFVKDSMFINQNQKKSTIFYKKIKQIKHRKEVIHFKVFLTKKLKNAKFVSFSRINFLDNFSFYVLLSYQ